MGSYRARVHFYILLAASFFFINFFPLAEANKGANCPIGAGNTIQAIAGSFREDLCPVGETSTESFILLILDKITLGDLLVYSGPFLTSFLQNSSLGLMNVNTAGSPGTEGGYLTLGAGTRLQGNWAVRRAYSRVEEEGRCVEVLYLRHSGKGTVPPGAILHPYTGALESLNSNRTGRVPLGALGDMLTQNGLAAAVLGNADTDQEGRQAVTVVMNGDGVVAYGDVSARLLDEDGFFPFGFRSSARNYLDAFEACREKASLIAVEWGDTGRIDAYLGHLSAKRRGELLQSSFGELDLFLEGLFVHPDMKSHLVILTPSPPQATAAGGGLLTPIIYHNPGDSRGGLLSSGTTRVPGIVANIDIAPTVLECLGLSSPAGFAGAPLRAQPVAGHLQKVSALAERTARTYQQRPPIIKGYLLVLIISAVAGLAGTITRFPPARLLKPVLYGLLYFPLSFLLAPAFAFFPAGSSLLNFCFVVVLVAVFVILGKFLWRGSMALFSGAGLMVFGFLVADLLGGSLLQSHSFMGFDPIGGARFYGMGNEYMGVMIGSFILGFGSLISLHMERQKEMATVAGMENKKGGHVADSMEIRVLIWIFAALSIIILFLMASPSFGANFGGTVTAALSLPLTLAGFIALLKGWAHPSWYRSLPGKEKRALSYLVFIGIPLLFILFMALLLYYLNLPRPGADISHLGRALELMQKGGPGELLGIASRKLEMNYKLVRYSLWTRALLVMIALTAVLYYYPTGLIKKIYAAWPGFRVAMGGIIAASVTALLVNDSGVVAAATIMLYGGVPLLILALEKNLGKTYDMAGNSPDKMEI